MEEKIKVNFMISESSKENIDKMKKFKKTTNSNLVDILLQFDNDANNLFTSLYKHQNAAKNVNTPLSANETCIPKDLLINLNSLFIKAQGKDETLSLVEDIEKFIHEKRLALNKPIHEESLGALASKYDKVEHGTLSDLVKSDTTLKLQ